jgi:hypothetical protein
MRTALCLLGLGIVSVLGVAAVPALRPTVDPTCGAPRLTLSAADPDSAFELRAGDDLNDPARWETLMRLAPGTHERVWFDPDVSKLGRRFYRLETRIPELPPVAENFALLDQTGKRHDFLREGDAKAVVLVFTDNARLADTWQAVRPLQEQFGPAGVRFWLVNPRDSRAAIATAAAGINAPVLHDVAQLVARTFGARAVQDVVALNRGFAETFYTGALATPCREPGGTNQPHLAAALEQFLAGQPVAVEHVKNSAASLGLEPLATPTFRTDIAPLLQAKCVTCHRPGDIGSFAMTNHAVVAEKAAGIRMNVAAGHMPPWHADPAHNRFANDFSLSPAEASRLVAWIDAGAPKGDAGDPLAEEPPAAPPAWPLGTPDKVVSIATQSLPATGEIPYRYLLVQNPFPSNVWLRAASVKPGNREVVHHSLVFVGKASQILQFQGGLAGFFAGYVPGMDQVAYPAGTGKRLLRGDLILVQMHYTPNGKATTDTTQLGFYLAPTPPARELTTTAVHDIAFTIPPGVRDHEVIAETVMARDSLLYELSPHMHYRGARMRFEALYPDGSAETLLNVPGYEFAWQALYRLTEPKRLPAGTRVRITGGFDNSEWNPWNPSPLSTVVFGEQTDDEMLIGYLNVAPE